MTFAIAVHEAGHCVVAAVLGHPPVRVRAADMTGRTYLDDRPAPAPVHVAIHEAGRAAELLMGCIPPTRSPADRERSSDAARRVARHRGGSPVDHLAQGIATAAGIVRTHRAAIERVAALLEASGELSGDELRVLLETPCRD